MGAAGADSFRQFQAHMRQLLAEMKARGPPDPRDTDIAAQLYRVMEGAQVRVGSRCLHSYIPVGVGVAVMAGHYLPLSGRRQLGTYSLPGACTCGCPRPLASPHPRM